MTYVATSEVTTLEHELRDDAVERRALVSLTFRSDAELSEVLGSLRHDVIVEIEVDRFLVHCSFVSLLIHLM